MSRLSAAARAAWLTDPVFVTLAKSLYGDDVDLSDIQADVFGKADPTPGDVHVKTSFWRKKKREQKEEDEETVESVGKSLADSVAKGELTNVEAYEVAKAWAQNVASVATGALAGGYVVSHHMHKNQIKQHIKSKHSGSYHKCNTCSVARESKVAKDWKDFDSKRKANAYVRTQVNRNPEKFHNDKELQSRGRKTTGAMLGTEAGAIGSIGAFLHASDMHDEAKRSEHNAKVYGRDTQHHVNMARDAQEMGHSENVIRRHMEAGKASYEAGMSADKAAGKFAVRSLHSGRAGAVGLVGTAALAGLARHEGKKTYERAREVAGARVTTKKSYDEHEVVWEGEFSKVDDDKRQVFGWASVTELDGKPVVDLQGDYIAPTEMERAAYDYVLKSRKGGDMHTRVDANGNVIEKSDHPLHVSDMIESMVFTPEKVAKLGLPEGSLPTGWWVGFKVNDDATWNLVKNGERKGFSIHGLGARMEKRLEEIDPQAALIGKAYAVSANTEEFKANLETIAELTGDEFYKHLHHGINNPEGHNQYDNGARNTAVGAGLGVAVGSHVGALAGMASGREAGREVGQSVGALTGAAVGAAIGHRSARVPQRPPIVDQHLGPKLEKTAKSVSTANRSGSVAHRQDFYSQQALQQATAQLAPQVAQHIQNMQQQQWQQAQIEQMQLQQQATGGQTPVNPQQQNWQTQQQQMNGQPMGPYGSQDISNGGLTPNQGQKSSSVTL